MSSQTNTLTEGPLAKQIFLVSLPLALSNLLVARFYGARHPKDVEKTVHSAAIISAVAGVVLLLIGLLGSPAMLRLLNTKVDLLPGAILYLRVYFLGMPALALYNFGNAVFSSIGDTKKPLMYLSIAGALNIALNLFFVIVCDLSVVGVALASAISQCVSAFLVLRALTRVKDCYALDFHKAALDPATTQRILALGIPAGLQNAIFAIANLFIQAGVNSFDSLMVKGNSAAANADNLIYDAMAAFYMACASFMSQNYGAGNLKRVKKGTWVTLAMGVLYTLCTGALLLAFQNPIMHLFTSDETVVAFGCSAMHYFCPFYFLLSILHGMAGAVRGTGRSVPPMVVLLVSLCLFRVVWIQFLLPFFSGIEGVFILYPVSWGLGALLMILYAWKGKWMEYHT